MQIAVGSAHTTEGLSTSVFLPRCPFFSALLHGVGEVRLLLPWPHHCRSGCCRGLCLSRVHDLITVFLSLSDSPTPILPRTAGPLGLAAMEDPRRQDRPPPPRASVARPSFPGMAVVMRAGCTADLMVLFDFQRHRWP
jgi:hypothetical protein